MTDPHVSEQPDAPRKKGQWVKGGPSPNPSGRPRNVSWHQKMRRELQSATPAVLARLLELAQAGNVDAMRLILSRSLAPAREDPVHLPDMAGSLSAQAQAVMQQVAAGTVAPSVGVELLQALGQVARIAEISELEERLAALEATQPPKP